MKIADKIIAQRKKQGWSQEELAERLDVSRQSVSKWESGLSVPELNKVVAMSELFGVSTDFLLKEDADLPVTQEKSTPPTAPCRTVSTQQAEQYLSLMERMSKRIALGVGLCVLSPVPLLVLLGASSSVEQEITAGAAVGWGVSVLLVLVGIALALFIPAGMRLAEYAYLENEPFVLQQGLEELLSQKREARARAYRRTVTVGVLICVGSAVPLILCGVTTIFPANATMLALYLLLLLCAVGVAMIVHTCCIEGAYQRLLQIGDYTKEKKRNKSRNDAFCVGYWCVVTALYLTVSFLFEAWHLTWIIWAAAGCLFPVALSLVPKK